MKVVKQLLILTALVPVPLAAQHTDVPYDVDRFSVLLRTRFGPHGIDQLNFSGPYVQHAGWGRLVVQPQS